MKRYSYIGSVVCLLCFVFCVRVSVQCQETLPYRCDFSNQAEVDKWQLNVGNTSTFKNKWYIGNKGEADHNEILYISGDGGATESYTNVENIVLSYRTLDLKAGRYDLAFDWKALGNDSSIAELRVALYPETLLETPLLNDFYSRSNYKGEQSLPMWMTVCMLEFDNVPGKVSLFGAVECNHATAQLSCPNDGKYRLTFVWVNRDSEKINLPGGCIDNIEIGSAGCGLPTNLSAVGSLKGSATFSWTGTAAEYEMKYTVQDENNWETIDKITDEYTVVNDLPFGIYEVHLRAICGRDTSVWAQFPMTFVYEAQCIDYLSIDRALCTHGSFVNPEEYVEIRDMGPSSKFSSHTIHYVQGEIDPRTVDRLGVDKAVLKTIPDKAVASVRLGNWDNGNKAESITFDYTVDVNTASIMLLKYAVVLESPGHEAIQQPRFKLEILDSYGNSVDELCGAADFTAQNNAEGWHTIVSDEIGAPVVWKDWSTVGLNLSQYDGQTLKIKLTTYDCSLGAHFGYAYFTIGCTVGNLEGMNCGDTPTTEFIAPEGFNYEWYDVADPDSIICRDRVMPVKPDDRRQFEVKIIYPTEERCHFTLEASAIPRFPKAEMSGYEHIPRDCRNYVAFHNTSHILLDGETRVDKMPDAVYWYCGENRTSMDINPTIEFPKEGYKGKGYLVASLSGGLCNDTVYFDLDIPAIGAVDTLVAMYKCERDVVVLPGDEEVSEPGEYVRTYQSAVTGCDSVVTYKISDVPSYEIYDTVSIVSGETYKFGTYELDETGDWDYMFETAEYAHLGCVCDSLVHLHLQVLETLTFDMVPWPEICHDDPYISFRFDIQEGSPERLKLTFDEKAKNVGGFSDLDTAYKGDGPFELNMPEAVVPGRYSVLVELSDGVIGYDSASVILDIRYGRSILAQRWNDVIGVKNDAHNGGFRFSACKWYVDGLEISGAADFNLYVSTGLSLTSVYSALLTRSNDGVEQYTCGFTPEDLGGIDPIPTIYGPGDVQHIEQEEPAEVRIYNIMGDLYDVQRLPQGGGDIRMPDVAGVYLLEMVFADGRRTKKIIVR